jgi:hypothetical protein
MPDQRTVELIHGRLDDAIEPAEARELDERLASDPEARQLAEELTGMSALLASIPEEEPPAQLSAGVMAELARSARSAPAVAGREAWSGSRRRSVALRFAFAMAAAVAVAFVMLPSLREAVDPRHASGTIGAQAPATAVTRVVPISGGSIAGSVRIAESRQKTSLELTFDRPAERTVRVAYDPALLAADAGGSPGLLALSGDGATTSIELRRLAGGPTVVVLAVSEANEMVEMKIELAR